MVGEYRDAFSNPWIAAGRRLVDDVIDPADTRKALVDALESLHTKRELRPGKKHGLIPL
jgi:methylmalonyl-CoA carboxyltransferase large subunit